MKHSDINYNLFHHYCHYLDKVDSLNNLQAVIMFNMIMLVIIIKKKQE